MTGIPSDQAARDRIRTDLTTNMLVEAGAGSGKTTALVERMLEHVRTGTPVEHLAAVTFTRKAANELRERFQVGLEQETATAAPGSTAAGYFETALRDLDRPFIGTIHAFCARILREHPLELGLDPEFAEVADEEDWRRLKRRFWRRWVERLKQQDDPVLAALRALRLEPQKLSNGFDRVVEYPDVAFPLEEVAVPDIAACRREVEALLAEADGIMPKAEPPDGWDDFMKAIRHLKFRRSVSNWNDVAAFCEAVAILTKKKCEPVQRRWASDRDGVERAKELGRKFAQAVEGPIGEALRCWREHRYPMVMRLLQRAAADFTRERRTTGQLAFADLLLLTAQLLRDHPGARQDLGARYAHLLVDEFQDTDPIQAEVCLLLASDPAQGNDWRAVVPRPGSLFVVGDPKQSIYRFRRADIQVYEAVKERMQRFGVVLALTTNFRSVKAIEQVVNDHFATTFPSRSTEEQSAFSRMETVHAGMGQDGVYRYSVLGSATGKKDMIATDAELVASWISRRIRDGERSAGDFLVLTPGKNAIVYYARALSERNIAVTTTGAPLLQERELHELLIVLKALADPENSVAVVAALEGLFFGLSPADLFDARRAGVTFSVTHHPEAPSHPVAQALDRLHAWWMHSQDHPADVVLEHIVRETGLLYHAAGSPLGDARAGALLHLVEALRASSLDSGTGIAGALDRLEILLAAEAPDAPLRPGRTDAVRVMNLHKAKGLEARVVVLAAPGDEEPHPVTFHVSRSAAGVPTGYLCLVHRDGFQKEIVAHPPAWQEKQEAEQRFEDAERERLRYVAATRAKHELVVAQGEKQLKTGPKPDESLWRPLAGVLSRHAEAISLPELAAEGRQVVERSATSLESAVQEADARREAAKAASLAVHSVTEGAKQPFGAPDPSLGPVRGGGKAWGRAVHACLEALGSGRRDDALRVFARAVARDEGFSGDDALRLEAFALGIESSPAWQQLLVAGGELLVELTVAQQAMDTGVATLTEGIMDAAALGPDGWLVVDWKSDLVSDAEWERRRVGYEAQVDAYARMVQEITGAPARGVVERVRG